jgi:hypothetical protein
LNFGVAKVVAEVLRRSSSLSSDPLDGIVVGALTYIVVGVALPLETGGANVVMTVPVRDRE